MFYIRVLKIIIRTWFKKKRKKWWIDKSDKAGVRNDICFYRWGKVEKNSRIRYNELLLYNIL